jgi:hypothetical protein
LRPERIAEFLLLNADEPDSEEALRMIAALSQPPAAEHTAQQQQQQQQQ